MIESLSLNSRISAAGFLLLGLAAWSVIASAEKLEKDQNCEVDSLSSLPPAYFGLFTPFCDPQPNTLPLRVPRALNGDSPDGEILVERILGRSC